MCTPEMTLYPIVGDLLAVLLGPIHASSFRAISCLVWALLACQSLHPADLARALPELRASSARQGMRRVRRALARSSLLSVTLTPHLVRLTLCLVKDQPIILVLDSTRCLGWEVFTLGVAFHGRVLPVAWSLLPYPWPRKRFSPTVVALLERTLRCWPNERPTHLVADRGFPSLKLFSCLEYWRGHLALGYTIRLRAGDWVYLVEANPADPGPSLEGPADAGKVRLADLLKPLATNAESWTSARASYSHRDRRSANAWLVIGQSQPIYPPHQRGPADQARRLARARRRQAHLLSKAQPEAPATDRVWILLTTCPTIEQARALYAVRFHTEGMYRDLKAWGLEAVAGHETDQRHLDGLLGLAALGYLIQAAIGALAGCAGASAQARQRQWCTTDRLSVFWRGRQVLHDRAFDWRPWLQTNLPELTRQLAPAPTTTQQATHPPTLTHSKEAA